MIYKTKITKQAFSNKHIKHFGEFCEQVNKSFLYRCIAQVGKS